MKKPVQGTGMYSLERETGFEPATSTLARLHSTTELLPRSTENYLVQTSGTVNRKKRYGAFFVMNCGLDSAGAWMDCREAIQN